MELKEVIQNQLKVLESFGFNRRKVEEKIGLSVNSIDQALSRGGNNSLMKKLELLIVALRNNNVPLGEVEKSNINQSNAKLLGHSVGTYKSKNREFIELSDGSYIMSTPLVNQKAYAGYLVGWGDPEYVEELPKHPIIVDKPYKGEYISFQVLGDSMDDGSADAIQAGDIITGRKIERSLWKSKLHLKKYREFIVVTMKGIIVKHVVDHDTERGVITCRSYNPDKEKYPDITVQLSQVMQLLNVIQVTKKRR